MKREEELKPCPFCGSSAHVEQYGDARQSTKYQCDDCGCMLETGEERDFGRDWNRRSLLPTPVGWETEAEWELEMRCANINENTPFDEVSKLINDLWQQYCLAAEPKPEATEGVAHEKATADVIAERHRQIEAEGFNANHDDGYTQGVLAQAGAAYALSAIGNTSSARGWWPSSWRRDWFKPTTTRRDLVKAAALIIAEIERIDRAALTAKQTDGSEE